MAGWLKLYRDLIKKPIWKLSTPEQKAILITILCMVNHEEEEWEWKGQKHICKPGQKITSLDKIAKEAGKGISIQNVRTAIERFKKLEFLTNESTKESRLITVLNWALYQSDEKNQQSNQQRGNKGVTTNKNDKNDKNINNILPNGSTSADTSDPVKEVIDFYNAHRRRMPEAETLSKARKGYINARLDEYGLDKVKEVILKAEASDFLNGGGDKAWVADLDWLMRPNNFPKVLEGKYDNKPEGNNHPPKPTNKPPGHYNGQRQYDAEFLKSLYENR